MSGSLHDAALSSEAPQVLLPHPLGAGVYSIKPGRAQRVASTHFAPLRPDSGATELHFAAPDVRILTMTRNAAEAHAHRAPFSEGRWSAARLRSLSPEDWEKQTVSPKWKVLSRGALFRARFALHLSQRFCCARNHNSHTRLRRLRRGVVFVSPRKSVAAYGERARSARGGDYHTVGDSLAHFHQGHRPRIRLIPSDHHWRLRARSPCPRNGFHRLWLTTWA